MVITQTLQEFLPKERIFTSSKNFNGELGLSLSIFQIDEWEPKISSFITTLFKIIWEAQFGSKKYDIVVLEYGIDRPKEMEFLLSIAKPDIGVFTAIDAVHSEQFGNPQEIAREEVKMVKNTKSTVFLNSDDPYAMELKDKIGVDVFTYQTAEHHNHKQIKEDIQFIQPLFVLNKHHIPELESTIAIKNTEFKIRTNLLSKENLGYI
jgi:UDP-N-acetylmuramyl pentapeptide synthase